MPNESGFRDSHHPDFLHQTRVSVRRLRSVFSLFAPLLKADPAALQLKADLRRIALPLGPARDADVLIARARQEQWPATALAALHAHRDAAYAAADAALADPRWPATFAALHAWLAGSPGGDPRTDPARQAQSVRPGLRVESTKDGGRSHQGGVAAQSPARSLTDVALHKRHHRIVAAGAQLLTMSEHHLHRVRIEGKKLRYGCQFFADLYADAPGTAPLDYYDALGGLQDALGAFNDAAVAADVCRAAGIPLALLGPPPQRQECVDAWTTVMALTPFWSPPPAPVE